MAAAHARPSKAQMDALWADANKEARIASHDVSFCGKCGRICTALCTGLIGLIVVCVLFGVAQADDSDLVFPAWFFVIALIACLVLPCALTSLAVDMMAVDLGPAGPFATPLSTPVDVPGTTTAADETKPYRNSRITDLMSTVHPSVKTCDDLWRFNLRRFADRPVFGTRDVVTAYAFKGELNGKMKTIQRVTLAPEYRWESWQHADVAVGCVCAGLTTLMDQEVPPTAAEDAAASGPEDVQAEEAGAAAGGEEAAVEEEPVTRHVGIFANTCPQFQKTMQACFRGNMPLCTVYATLGSDGLAWAVHLCEIRILVTEADKLPVIAKMAGGVTIDDDGKEVECTAASLRNIVVLGERSAFAEHAEAIATLAARPAEQGGPVRVITFDELSALGTPAAAGAAAVDFNAEAFRGIEGVEADPARALMEGVGAGLRDGRDKPTPEDTAVIMFTSGTTGLPKGVVIKHRNLLAGVAGISSGIPDLDGNDRYIAYLPLAHVLELAAELTLMTGGARVGYSHPFRLTGKSPLIGQVGDDSPHAPTEPIAGDTGALKPTVLAGVPAVFDKFRKLVTAGLAARGGLPAKLFANGYEARVAAMKRGARAPFWEGIILDKIRGGVLGGKVRVMISGGGPLSPETQEWAQAVFRCPMGQGYGLTETCGASTIAWCNDRTFGRIGPPIQCNDIKLVSWDEGGYDAHANPPRGEICVSGDNITAGYYKMPEKTAKDFVMEGGRLWFHTGDIGQFDRDGVLRIIDRKKDLVKLSKGEYVSLGKVEAKAALCAAVFNLCVYADSQKDHTVAVATVNAAALPEQFRSMDEATLMASADAAKALQQMVSKVCLGAGCARFEVPTKVAIVGTEEWLPPTGLVTASLKMQRRKIYDRFRAELDTLYGAAPAPAAAAAACGNV